MGAPDRPVRTRTDTALTVIFWACLTAGAVVRMTGGPVPAAGVLTVSALAAGAWAAWRAYDREPDGRRGE